MRIVSQPASFSHSPPFPLLPAPKIAGLLPASVPPAPVYTILRASDDKPVFNIPTPEELYREMAMIFVRIAQRMEDAVAQ
jgi:hypothetical protein